MALKRLGPVIVALAVSVSIAPRVQAAERAFSFRQAEFLPEDDARRAGEAFVRDAFPSGLPLAEARRRAQQAGLGCVPGPEGRLVCLYIMPVHQEGGIIGEDTWTLVLTPDGRGGLADARLTYVRKGVSD